MEIYAKEMGDKIFKVGIASADSVPIHLNISDDDEDGERITVRSDDELKAMFQMVSEKAVNFLLYDSN